MSLRLAMAVVGATTAGVGGIAAKNGALEQYGISPTMFDPSQFQTTMHTFDGGSSGRPASVIGSNGAKFVSVTPNENDPAQTPDGNEQILRDKLFETLGFHTGPDPREGHSLDALKMRQKDAQGQLDVEDIGMDAMMKDIQTEMQNTEF